MLKQLFTALKSGDPLDEAFAEFAEMLRHAHWMFGKANDVLRGHAAAAEIGDAIYERDIAINKLLRSIRHRIVTHLTVNPGSDVAASLALISVAKDAERIGDYCKNVFEVGRFYGTGFHVDRYHGPLEEIRGEVMALFDDVIAAFTESVVKDARAAIAKADSIGDRCDDIVEQLLKDDQSLDVHEAVAYSLLARHYKRVASHLSNVCTAVTGKIEQLDFRG